MQRITCPRNKDCYIDCPGSGYAFYVEPYGPCAKDCTQESAGDVLIRVMLDAGDKAEFSGIVVGITTRVLANFARDIAQRAPSTSAGDIAKLQRLDIIRDDRRITASWNNTGMAGVIHALANAATGTKDSGQASAA